MKKVSYDKVEHTISTKGKNGSKQYAFADYSDSIKLEDLTKLRGLKNKFKDTPKKEVKQKVVIKTIIPGNALRVNTTHVTVPCVPYKSKGGGNVMVVDQVIVIDRYITVSKIRKMYPSATELMYSIDNEVFGDKIIFANAK